MTLYPVCTESTECKGHAAHKRLTQGKEHPVFSSIKSCLWFKEGSVYMRKVIKKLIYNYLVGADE